MPDVKSMSPEEKEQFHQAAEARIATFAYRPPAASDKVKEVIPLCRSDLGRVYVQVVREGGENNLHYHVNSDTCWTVLRGRARFYGVDDKLLGEFGPYQGILIPGGSRYWFEKAGEEPLEILQMVGIDKAKGDDRRINLERHKEWMSDTFLQVYDKS
ncbi:MAG TPA: hypothetical protein VN832_02485 [Stellaceae bacterium]|nr:hypothetical protein [Stellaceae bacterium]